MTIRRTSCTYALGTRGSLPKPGPTTCAMAATPRVSRCARPGDLIVLDCGSGGAWLGQALLAEAAGPRHGHLLISHTQDHIQGFPFFAPLFVPGHVWDIYGPGSGRTSGEPHRADGYAYFPITLGQLGATVATMTRRGTFTVDDVCITTRYLNHPALAWISAGGRWGSWSMPPITSPMPVAPTSPARPRRVLPVHHEDRGHIGVSPWADLIIPTPSTATEYAQKIGWGHSPVTYVVDVALAARGQRLALFHHDPAREDAGDRVLACAASGRLPPGVPWTSSRQRRAMARTVRRYRCASDCNLPHRRCLSVRRLGRRPPERC